MPDDGLIVRNISQTVVGSFFNIPHIEVSHVKIRRNSEIPLFSLYLPLNGVQRYELKQNLIHQLIEIQVFFLVVSDHFVLKPYVQCVIS